MNLEPNAAQNPPSGIMRRPALTLSISVASAGLGLAAALLVGLASTQTTFEKAFLIAAIFFVIGVLGPVSFLMLRRGKSQTAAWILIGVFVFAFPAFTALIEGLGLMFALAAVLIIPAIGSETFGSGQNIQRATILGIFSGVACLVIDFYTPLERLALPSLAPIILILNILLAVTLLAIIGRQFRAYSLRTKMIISFLAISLIPLVALTLLNDRSTRSALEDQSNQKLFAAASQMSATIDSFLEANKDEVRTEAQLTTLESFLALPVAQRAGSELERSSASILDVLKRKNVTNITSYGILDLNGANILDTNSDLVGMDESQNDYYIEVIENGLPYVSNVQIPDDSGVPSIYFSSPIRHTDGKILGVLRFRYRARVFQEMLVQNAGLAGEDSFAVLFDEFHIHLAHSTAPETIMKAVGPLAPDLARELQSAKRLPQLPLEDLSTNLPELENQLNQMDQFPFFEAEDVATGARINQVAVTSVAEKPWLVAFLQPQDVLFRPIEDQTRNIVLFAFLITGVVVIAAVGISQLLSRPILKLTDVATQVAEGDLTAYVPEESSDEIGMLAHAFNSMTVRLRDMISGLEDRVAERTTDLERRANQLQAAAEIAKDAAVIRDVGLLLEEAVLLISDRFGFYHAGVFLVDEAGEEAVLRAASSDGGKRMLARGHQLAVGKVGIVGYVTGTGRPRIALDVGADAVHFQNPDLPLTRSEMALPLSVADRVIGALDVQSVEANAFKDDDVVVLQTMADQLAIAIENARLLAQQTHVASQRRRAIELYRNLTQQLSYDQLLATVASLIRDAFGYTRVTLTMTDGNELVVRSAAATPPLIPARLGDHTPITQGSLGQAISQRMPLLVNQKDDYGASYGDLDLDRVQAMLIVPLISRGTIVGALIVEEPSSEAFDEDEIELVELLAGQVAVSLENARLFEETERSLRQVDALYRQQTSEAWSELIDGQLPSEREVRYESEQARNLPIENIDEYTIETPIALRGEVIGRFNVQSPDQGDWSDEELFILEAVADDVADHLEQVRLVQEVRRRATQVEAAAEIARVATGVLDLPTLLNEVVKVIRDRFDYYYVAVFLVDEDAGEIKLREAAGASGKELIDQEHSVAIGSRSIIGRVKESASSYVSLDVSEDPYFAPNTLLPETQSELAVPITLGENVVGVLDVQGSRVNAFGDEEIAVLEALADQLAVAIQNARLFQDTLNRAEREQAVVEITSKIRAGGTVDEMLQIAVGEIRQHFGAKSGRVQLRPAEPGRDAGLDSIGQVTTASEENGKFGVPDTNGRNDHGLSEEAT